jgi:hypothetical protein
MADLKYDDNDTLPIDLVYNAIFSDSNAVDIIVAAHLPAAIGAWIAAQKRNRSQDTNLVLPPYLFQLPFSGS